jgi:hypothetical protein
VLNFALRHVEVLGKRGITPRILNLDNGWGWVLLYPGGNNLGTHSIQGCVGPELV